MTRCRARNASAWLHQRSRECARLGKIASPPPVGPMRHRPQSLTISPRRVPLTSESAGIIRRAVSLGAGRKSRTNANDKKSNRHETTSTDRDIRHMSLRSDRLRSAGRSTIRAVERRARLDGCLRPGAGSTRTKPPISLELTEVPGPVDPAYPNAPAIVAGLDNAHDPHKAMPRNSASPNLKLDISGRIGSLHHLNRIATKIEARCSIWCVIDDKARCGTEKANHRRLSNHRQRLGSVGDRRMRTGKRYPQPTLRSATEAVHCDRPRPRLASDQVGMRLERRSPSSIPCGVGPSLSPFN